MVDMKLNALKIIMICYLVYLLSLSFLPAAGADESASKEFLIGVEEIDQEFLDAIATNNAVIVRRMDQINVVLVRVEGASAQSLAHTLGGVDTVRFLEPNTFVELPPFEVGPIVETSEIRSLGPPDDTFWSFDPWTGLGQWNIRVINAPEGWQIQKGSHSVIVAVLDTGIRATHHDLLANYVPLGFNWVDNDADTSDDNGHGTHVAGVIAAETNNSYGIAGLAQVWVMAEKVLDANGVGTLADVASGIIHAADAGADIICMSFGSYDYSLTVKSAVDYAYGKGSLPIAAAGNDGIDIPMYPAALENVVAVGATYGEPDMLAPYSNYGAWIELTAPGGADEDLDGWIDNGEHWILSTWHAGDDTFAYLSGTSMAAPHVAGQAALFLSEHPSATNMEVREVLQDSAEDKGPIGWDQYYGYGRIDVERSLQTYPPSIGGEGSPIYLKSLTHISSKVDNYVVFAYILTSSILLICSLLLTCSHAP